MATLLSAGLYLGSRFLEPIGKQWLQASETCIASEEVPNRPRYENLLQHHSLVWMSIQHPELSQCASYLILLAGKAAAVASLFFSIQTLPISASIACVLSVSSIVLATLPETKERYVNLPITALTSIVMFHHIIRKTPLPLTLLFSAHFIAVKTLMPKTMETLQYTRELLTLLQIKPHDIDALSHYQTSLETTKLCHSSKKKLQHAVYQLITEAQIGKIREQMSKFRARKCQVNTSLELTLFYRELNREREAIKQHYAKKSLPHLVRRELASFSQETAALKQELLQTISSLFMNELHSTHEAFKSQLRKLETEIYRCQEYKSEIAQGYERLLHRGLGIAISGSPWRKNIQDNLDAAAQMLQEKPYEDYEQVVKEFPSLKNKLLSYHEKQNILQQSLKMRADQLADTVFKETQNGLETIEVEMTRYTQGYSLEKTGKYYTIPSTVPSLFEFVRGIRRRVTDLNTIIEQRTLVNQALTKLIHFGPFLDLSKQEIADQRQVSCYQLILDLKRDLAVQLLNRTFITQEFQKVRECKSGILARARLHQNLQEYLAELIPLHPNSAPLQDLFQTIEDYGETLRERVSRIQFRNY